MLTQEQQVEIYHIVNIIENDKYKYTTFVDIFNRQNLYFDNYINFIVDFQFHFFKVFKILNYVKLERVLGHKLVFCPETRYLSDDYCKNYLNDIHIAELLNVGVIDSLQVVYEDDLTYEERFYL